MRSALLRLAFLLLVLGVGAAPSWASEDPTADLYAAIQSGDLAAVELAISSGARLAGLNEAGFSPVGWGVLHGNADVVATLLTRGAGVEQADAFRYTPLFWAVRTNSEAMVNLLLKRRASVHRAGPQEMTPLMFAAYLDKKRVLEPLLRAGADPDRVVSNRSATSLATLHSHPDTLRLFALYRTSRREGPDLPVIKRVEAPEGQPETDLGVRPLAVEAERAPIDPASLFGGPDADGGREKDPAKVQKN